MPIHVVAMTTGKIIAKVLKILGPLGCVLVVIVVALTSMAGFRAVAALFKRDVSFSSGPAAIHFEKIAELVVLRTRFADILQAELRSGDGPGRIKGEWVVYGGATYSVDLREAKVLSVDKDGRVATVMLPPIEVWAAVDHEHSKDLSMSFADFFETRKVVNAWVFSPSILFQDKDAPLGNMTMSKAALASVNRHMQRLIEYHAQAADHMLVAKVQAQTVIQEMYAPFGWTIEIQWDEQLPTRDSKDMVSEGN
jgi:hypothetical protein